MTRRSATPVTVALAGGEVLLVGSDVIRVRSALRLAERVASRDGIGSSSAALSAALDLAVSRLNLTVASPPAVDTRPPMDDEIGTAQAAAILGMSRRHVQRLASDGELEGRLRNGSWFVSRASVMDRVEVVAERRRRLEQRRQR